MDDCCAKTVKLHKKVDVQKLLLIASIDSSVSAVTRNDSSHLT